MKKDKMIELYLKGYEDGLKEAWKRAKSMVSHYDGWELKSRMEGKIGTLYQDVRSKRYELEDDFSLFVEEESPNVITTPDLPDIRKGEMYLFLERRPEVSFDIFFKYVSEIERGLCITSEKIKKITEKYGKHDGVSYYNLGKSKSQGRLDYETIYYGSLNKLGTVIGEYFKENPGSIMLFHGMDRMIHYVEFTKLQKFVDFIREKANGNNGIIIVTLPPDILEEKKFNQFRNSFDGEYSKEN